MRPYDLDAMFHPRAVALVGASNEPTKLSGRPLRFFREYGYRGRVYPVNPKYRDIAGLPCYPTLADTPDGVDLAVISLPAAAVPGAVAACGEKGVKAAAIISAGFAETGEDGAALQRELQDAASSYGVAVCGPNCSGFIYLPECVTATFSSGLEYALPPVGPIAFIAQSGALASYIMEGAGRLGLGFNYWVTTGNEAVLGFSDYLAYVLEDPQVKMVMGYLEEARDGETFTTALQRAAVLDKPVVLLKVGRSELGARASASHTGAMVGTDAVYQAVFDRYGVLRADSIAEMFDMAEVVLAANRPRGPRVQLVTISGGAGVLMADAVSAEGLSLSDLSPAGREELRAVLPSMGTVANPLDLTAELVSRQDFFRTALGIAASDPEVDSLVIFLGIVPGAEPSLAEAVADLARHTTKYIQVVWFPLPGKEPLRILRAAGVPVSSEPARAIRSLAQRLKGERARERSGRSQSVPGGEEVAPGDDPEFRVAKAQGRRCLTEFESKAVLKRWGLPAPHGGLAASAVEAQTLAERIGFPVAMKVVSPDILHKTEAGGVELDLGDKEEVERAYGQLVERAETHLPSAVMHGVLVEEMVAGPLRELIVGAKVDPHFGPVVLIGIGGTLTELLGDTVTDLAPVTLDEAGAMIGRLRGLALLTGFRGAPPSDVDALAQALCEVSLRFADSADLLEELDINPLFVLPKGQGVRVGDALFVLKGP
ncbi:MAG: acetate--CoA ligase family protein [Actinobacteria bacterium]|nr:acetate--CoA ligase family protein [Actinomycetota bacterium]